MINKSLSSRKIPLRKSGDIFVKSRPAVVQWMTFFNVGEDDPIIPSPDFGDSKDGVYKLSKMKETLGRSGSW